MSKLHVSIKAVEAVNAKFQQQGTGSTDRAQQTVFSNVKPATPSRTAIQQAGERALQALDKKS